MDQNTAIALYQIAEKQQPQGNPALISSIDNCVVELGSLAARGLGRSPQMDEILPAIFEDAASLIADHCLNPSRFWMLITRYALVLSQGEKSGLKAFEQAVQGLRADHRAIQLGQYYFLNGIADSATCTALTAKGFLLWDAGKHQIKMCPLHWSDRDLQRFSER